MADVAHPASAPPVAAGLAEQVALIAGLRWRLFVNSLRTWRGRLDLIATVVAGILAGLGALGIGVGLGVVAYTSVERGRTFGLTFLMWGVFVGWQLFPVLIATASAEFDFRNLLRFPLRFPTFFLLSLAYGLFDPAGLTALVWLCCIGAGIFFSRPELLPWCVLVLAVFALTNLLLNRLIFSWVERLLAQRRGREALFAALLLLMLSLQLFGALAERWVARPLPVLRKLAPVVQALPPGLAGHGLISAVRHRPTAVLGSTALLIAYGLGFSLVLRRRVRAQYLGEDLGEAPAPALRARETAGLSWRLPGLPAAVAAVFEKEMRYLGRVVPLALMVILPAIFAVFFALLPLSRQRSDFFKRIPDLLFPMTVGYALLILAPQVHNAFAFDRRGIQLVMFAPVRFRDVLLGKNLADAVKVFGEAITIWLLMGLLREWPGAAVVAATFSALLFATVVHLIAGNWLSLYFPRAFDLERFRQRAAGVTVLAGLVLQIIVLGVAAWVFSVTRRSGQLWLATLIFLGLSLAALWVYRLLLGEWDGIATRQREVLTRELCR